MPPINLHGHCLLFALVVLCTAWTTVSVQAAEFLPDLLIDDPRPQAPFAHEVEVALRPVMATQVLGEEMLVTVTMKNICPASVRLPHGWGNNYLCDVWIEVDREFAAQQGIHLCDAKCYSISAPVFRLLPGKNAHATIDLGCYLTFTKPVRPPVPVTWKLELRTGEKKSGHFLLHIQFPTDPLDEVMEQLRREQDKYLPSMIELPEVPTALTK